MDRIIVAGIGTGVGKTIVSAILVTALKGTYWKPIETGESDSQTMQGLINPSSCSIYPSVYSLKASLSPHHSAKLEGVVIDPKKVFLPQAKCPLVIESAGGVFAPLQVDFTNLDLFKHWKASWILVSRHYLGSINHTLLTIDTLKRKNIPLVGIIFNGKPNPDSEEAILRLSSIPVLGKVFQEPKITKSIIQRYAERWKTQFLG